MRISDLTEEERARCISMVESGSAIHVALAAHGMAQRTIRENRQRYEGTHPTRGSSPEIDSFFDELYRAQALFRAMKEIEVANIDAKTWLKYMARSRPGLEGWSDLVPDEPVGRASAPVALEQTPEEFEASIRVLATSLGILRRCADIECPCPDHGKEEKDEQVKD